MNVALYNKTQYNRVVLLKKRIIVPFCLLVFTLNGSCAKEDDLNILNNVTYSESTCAFTDDYTPNPNDTTSIYLDWNHPALEEMRKRADLIGNIRWMPLGEIPKRYGVFPQGIEVKGIPYSSVKELDKFVGQEVSFYTFLSTVNNPRSVLYTENVGKAPYRGSNCASYYGSVCSMTVNYALGLDRPYETKMYGALPFFKRVSEQDLDHASPGDIVHFLYGHVILITNITKDGDGNIIFFDILESVASGTFNKKYNKQQLQERLDKYEHVIYRYTDLEKLSLESSPFPAIEASLDMGNMSKALSLTRGDKVTYCEDDNDVKVNVLIDGYNRLEIYKLNGDETEFVKSIYFEGTPDLLLDDLHIGNYKVLLRNNDGDSSEAVHFEILQTSVGFSYLPGNYVDIHFNSINSVPEYIVFCRENGSRCFISDISEEERQSGHKLVKCVASLDALYLKVFFRGKYGRVSNSTIPLRIDLAYQE